MTQNPSRRAALLLTAIVALAAIVAGSSPVTRGRSVEGKVVDPRGNPIAGATVRHKGTATAVLSDSDGRFRLFDGIGRVTASKAGFRIAGADDATRVVLRLQPLPREDNATYGWVDPTPGGSQNCGTCHTETYREWAVSGHARSATGTFFRDLYEGTDAAGRPGAGWGLKTEVPNAAGVCSACHAPAIVDADPARFDLGQVQGVASFGVHCDFCHKVSGTGQGPPGLTHGTFDLRLTRPAEGQLFFGPLDDVDRGEDVYSPVYHDSRYCASCHEGTVLGVHVYSTYSEWLASPARREGKQCQDCHMAPTGAMTNVAPDHGGIERDPRSLASHRLFIGSQADMLRKALQVEIKLNREQTAVRVTIRLRADAVGHRVPTGFIDRHLLLVVTGWDTAGRRLETIQGPRLGQVAGSKLAGFPGKLYARLRANLDGHNPIPFWRAGTDPVDTRLSPGVTDENNFTFPSALARIRVRLLYRRFWEEVRLAKGWEEMEVIVFDEERAAPLQADIQE